MNPDIDIYEPGPRPLHQPHWNSRPGPVVPGYRYRVVMGRELGPDVEFMVLPKSSLVEVAGLCAALNNACLSSEIMEMMEFRVAENWGLTTPVHQLNYAIVRDKQFLSQSH